MFPGPREYQGYFRCMDLDETGLRMVISVQNWTVTGRSASDTVKIPWFSARPVFKDLYSLRLTPNQSPPTALFWWARIPEKTCSMFLSESHSWSRASGVFTFELPLCLVVHCSWDVWCWKRLLCYCTFVQPRPGKKCSCWTLGGY